MTATTISIDALIKDLCPNPGTRIKQWVVDARRERAWTVETCPRVDVADHVDNCGGACRNVGSTIWSDLAHDSCHTCGDLQEATRDRPDIAAWRAEAAARPPICSDRTVLSDEIAPDWTIMSKHPLLKIAPRSKP